MMSRNGLQLGLDVGATLAKIAASRPDRAEPSFELLPSAADHTSYQTPSIEVPEHAHLSFASGTAAQSFGSGSVRSLGIGPSSSYQVQTLVSGGPKRLA